MTFQLKEEYTSDFETVTTTASLGDTPRGGVQQDAQAFMGTPGVTTVTEYGSIFYRKVHPLNVIVHRKNYHSFTVAVLKGTDTIVEVRVPIT